jgi:uncharacterized protein (TIGR03437 family)
MKWILLFLATSAAALAQANVPAIDSAMQNLLRRYDAPGGAIAITYQNRLVYAKGFGVKDKVHNEAFHPDTPARVGSISKPLTALAVLRLVDTGRLRLEDRVLDVLGETIAPRALIKDTRWTQITVRHLLQHSGGLDAAETYDPLFLPPEIYRAVLPSLPPQPKDILQLLLAEPLQFAPGTRYAYSNFGYSMLGLVVERVTGKRYGEAVRELVLSRLDAPRVRLGSVPTSLRWLGEANYYLPAAAEPVESVYEPGLLVAPPDGALWSEHIESSGGWTMSAVDMARLFLAVDGRRGTALLSPQLLREVTSRPSYAAPNDPVYYGLGFIVQPDGTGFNLAHDGYIGGSLANAIRAERNSLGIFVVFNGTPEEGEKVAEFFEAVNTGLTAAVLNAGPWGTTDLWTTYFPLNQLRIASDGVVSAASGLVTPLVASSYVSVLGEGLQQSRVNLNGISIEPLYASATQVNFRLPATLSGATAQIAIERGGLRSNTVTLPIAQAAPALFTLSGNGRGTAIATRGTQAITVYATGIAAIAANQLRVFVDGAPVTVLGIDGLAVLLQADPTRASGKPLRLEFPGVPARNDTRLPIF